MNSYDLNRVYPNITRKLRSAVWRKYFGQYQEGCCCNCGKGMIQNSNEWGVAYITRGRLCAKNLIILCNNCNQYSGFIDLYQLDCNTRQAMEIDEIV